MPSLLSSAINATGTSAGRMLRSGAQSATRNAAFSGSSSVMGSSRLPPPTPSPSLSMPSPTSTPSSAARLSTMGSASARSAIGNIAFGTGVGAVTGGIYNSQDGFSLSGAAKGALGGAIVGSMSGFGVPAAARAAVGNNRFMSTAGSYSSKMLELGQAITSSYGRNAMFGAGGLLGGALFSGEGKPSKARGFNSTRGSRIQGY